MPFLKQLYSHLGLTEWEIVYAGKSKSIPHSAYTEAFAASVNKVYDLTYALAYV